MVGHAGLRIIVGADLCGTVTCRHHGLTLGSDTVEVLLVLHVVQTRTKFFESTIQVLQLRTLLLALDHDSGRDMGQTDS